MLLCERREAENVLIFASHRNSNCRLVAAASTSGAIFKFEKTDYAACYPTG